MKIIEETDKYIVMSSCPICKQVGHKTSVLMYKIKELGTNKWDGKLLKCGMCQTILTINKNEPLPE